MERYSEPVTRCARAGADHGRHGHSTPDPETPPPDTTPPSAPVPDDVPIPEHAPVKEPTLPEPPIRA